MDIRVKYLGGKKFEMIARNHHLIADQPFDNDGADTGMTPTELFLSSVGACAAYYAHEYLQARCLPHEDLEIRVSAEKGDRPVRITSLRLNVIAPALNQRHRDGVLRAVDACLIKNTLVVPPHIEVTVSGSAQCSVDDHELTAVG